MAIKETSSVTSWIRNELYQKMVAEKYQRGISMQKLAAEILEGHYQQHFKKEDAFQQIQVENIKNKFRLQTLFQLLDQHTFEGSKKYRELVEQELEKFMTS